MSLFIKTINPRIKVYGVESEAMAGMLESVKAGHIVTVPRRPSIADGIAIERIGQVTFPIIQRYVDQIVTVKEDEIASAVLTLLEREKTVVEGSGAAALAALKQLDIKDQTVAIVLTGGNIDMTVLTQVIDKGLVKEGRLARIRVLVRDVPGQLSKVCQILTEMRANIKDIEHERAFLVADVGMTQPIFTIETQGFNHVKEILEKIEMAGFPKPHIQTPTKQDD